MSQRILEQAVKNNDLVFFKKKNDDGMEFWYSGYIKELLPESFKFSSIYGSDYSFNIKEIIDLKGPKVTYVADVFGEKDKLIYLVFDTETTGLPKNWNAPITDTDNWPRVIQLSWSIHDDAGNELEHNDILIKPDGFEIPKETSDIHGITTEKALNEGIPLKEAIDIFNAAIKKSNVLIAHNISFDEKVMGCEFYRLKMNNPIEMKAKICTKEASVDYCKIPGRNGRYSWASLNDLYKILFNEIFDNQHNASFDVKACAKCFFELKRLGVIR